MTIETTVFDDTWYGNMILDTRRSFDEHTSPDSIAVAIGIMIAGAMLSQAIDHAFSGPRGEATTREMLQELSGSVAEFVEAFQESQTAKAP